MSGTSIDGIDVALVDFSSKQPRLVKNSNHSIPKEIKTQLIGISNPSNIGSTVSENRIECMARLDIIMGHLFAEAVNVFLKEHSIERNTIGAIGSHGQTIRHRVSGQHPFSLQIGDANIIAEKTAIKTVADFRRSDIAAGGQGAPLAPAFHNAVLRSNSENRVVLNLGGIANITLLNQSSSVPIIGFDTGPANTLLDAWFMRHYPHHDDEFDRDSHFALKGTSNKRLLQQLKQDEYFKLPHPKSTGREYFSLDWLDCQLNRFAHFVTPQDVQRTLLDLTAETVANSIIQCGYKDALVLSCGGGMHNKKLIALISLKLTHSIKQTNDVGVDGDYLEAMTFAWLAKQRMEQLAGNIKSVTGAKKDKILGGVYLP